MKEYARQRGLRRLLISVPVLTPYLSSLWLGFVTPVYARTGRKLIEGLRNPTVVQDDSAMKEFTIQPRGLSEAIERALANEDLEYAETRWSDAISSGGDPARRDGQRFGGRIVDSRSKDVDVSVESAFDPIQRIGGDKGWYFGNWLWKIRGFMDLLVGGVGMRRGRRHPVDLHQGDSLDFWRVEAFDPPHRLRLFAEMRLPGRGWLDFEVTKIEGGARIHQTATFDPVGLTGRAYWYLLYPIHRLVFAGMLRGIARAAKRSASEASGD